MTTVPRITDIELNIRTRRSSGMLGKGLGLALALVAAAVIWLQPSALSPSQARSASAVKEPTASVARTGDTERTPDTLGTHLADSTDAAVDP